MDKKQAPKKKLSSVGRAAVILAIIVGIIEIPVNGAIAFFSSVGLIYGTFNYFSFAALVYTIVVILVTFSLLVSTIAGLVFSRKALKTGETKNVSKAVIFTAIGFLGMLAFFLMINSFGPSIVHLNMIQ